MTIRARRSGSTLDAPPALELLGRVKVWELARLAGISVDAVVSEVVRAGGLPVFPGLGRPQLRTRTERVEETIGPEPEPEPALAEMVGRATLREVKAVVDRWVLARVFEQNDWNVTRTAAQLGVSRRTLRERRARVRELPVESLVAGPSGRPRRSTASTSAPSLTELLEQGASYREIHQAIEQWLVGCTLDGKGGNVTRSANSLNTTRRKVRSVRGAS